MYTLWHFGDEGGNPLYVLILEFFVLILELQGA